MQLLDIVRSNLEANALVPTGSSVLAAVSGGMDSMVLLELLAALAPAMKFTVQAAHFNHCLRGTESDADEQFVREHAAGRGLPFFSARGDVRALASAEGLSIEMAARKLRGAFLSETARAGGCAVIALAHHADDQVETFWLRLLRGDAGSGLAGMARARPDFEAPEIRVVRPLLNVTKGVLADFAAARSVPFREDSSNAEREFQRNRLRHEILPRLREFQPRLDAITLRTEAILRDEKDFIAECAADWLRQQTAAFEALHPALQREIVRTQLLELGVSPAAHLIEDLQASGGPAVTAPPGILLRNKNGRLHRVETTEREFRSEGFECDLATGGIAVFAGIECRWETVQARGEPLPGTEYLDLDKLGPKIVLRHWNAGDRFWPSGLAAPAKLQDLFTNAKIPAEEKRRRIVAVAANGSICWVEGLRISHEFKVQPGSVRVLKWFARRT